MPRRRQVQPRVILPDPKFGSELVTKFINTVMRRGKKSIAESIVYSAIGYIAKNSANIKLAQPDREDDSGDAGVGGDTGQTTSSDDTGSGKQGLDVFTIAVKNVCPLVEVRSRRVGGATYQVPVEVPPRRSRALAMRWLIDCAKKRSEKTMWQRLAAELLDAAQGRGEAMKVRENMHRMAKANQAFAHYRW